MTDDRCVEPVNCLTASEFVDLLRPSHELWRGEALETEWLFRGHSDATWELKPAAWRKDEDIGKWKKMKELIEKSDVFERHQKPFKDLSKPPFPHEAEEREAWRGLSAEVQRERIQAGLLQAAFELQVIRDFWTIANQAGHPLGELSWANIDFHAQLGHFFHEEVSKPILGGRGWTNGKPRFCQRRGFATAPTPATPSESGFETSS